MLLRPIRAILALACLAATAAAAEPVRLAVLGDAPYGPPAKVYAPYAALIAAINAAGPDLAIHVGDTKSGGRRQPFQRTVPNSARS